MNGIDLVVMEKIGMNLRALRKERGIRQKELAALLGIDQATVSKWESGSHSMTVEHFFLLCDFFDVSADYLAGRDVAVAGDPVEREILSACRQDLEIKNSIASLLGIKNVIGAAG